MKQNALFWTPQVKTLINTINSLFTENLDDKEMMSLLQSLRDRKYIVIKDTKVSYQLPKQIPVSTDSASTSAQA